jgi:hypothetical protein
MRFQQNAIHCLFAILVTNFTLDHIIIFTTNPLKTYRINIGFGGIGISLEFLLDPIEILVLLKTIKIT